MKKTWKLIAVISILGLIAAGCGGDDTTQTTSAPQTTAAPAPETTAAPTTAAPAPETTAAPEEEPEGPIRFGQVADFSDVYSFYDVPVRDGALYAIEEINAAGGVLGRQLKLVAIDGRNDQAETTRATEELLDSGVSYLIGTTGDPFLAQAALACEAGVPISTGDGTAPTLVGDAGECAYHVIMSDNLQGAVAAEYALGVGHATAYLLFSPEIDYTNLLPQFFQEAFENSGGTVIGSAAYTMIAGDYSAQVTEIGNLDPAPDVIYTPMFIPDTPVFMRQLRQAGINIPVISADGNHDVSLLDAGEAVEGMVFTTHAFPSEGSALADLFDTVAETGSYPDSVVFGLGYDEIYMIASIIEAQGDASAAAILAGLPSLSYEGVTGSVNMDPDTRRADKSVALVGVVDGELRFVDQFVPEFVPAVE